MSLLKTYRNKRDFTKTPEPPPGAITKKQGYSFCVQKHDATRLHYDFRLELDGVLKSWAVTRGPSLDPSDKRLAVRTEDHPLAYGDFEGTIPHGQYGGGTVMLWDEGYWEPIGDPHDGIKAGNLKFTLHGQRMQGKWVLVRMRAKEGEKHKNWLLIKENDDEAHHGDDGAFLDDNAFSVKTGRKMETIAAGTDVWQSRPVKHDAKLKKKLEIKHKEASRHITSLTSKYKSPQLATLVEEIPKGNEWVHEIKFDGYRILCFVSHGEVAIRTRNGHDWTDRFPTIANALAELDVDNAVFDGEAVVHDDKGRTDFQDLQAALGEGGDTSQIHAYLFDLLHLNNIDLTKRPLVARKTLLRRTLSDIDLETGPLHFSDHMSEHADLIGKVCELGLEGIISKKAHAPYLMARSKSWVKSKCGLRQEFVIVGFTKAKNNHRAIGALHLAYTKDDKLVYAGKVGTGFSGSSAQQIRDMLEPFIVKKAPISGISLLAQRGSTWVKPELLCEVSFTEWTGEGHVRHPSFEGMRADKRPEDVTIEKPVALEETKSKKTADKMIVSGVTITHPERIEFPDTGLTKGELAEYYGAVAKLMMPDIAGHPISLLRCPSGVGAECFFQRNPDKYMRKNVHPFPWTHNNKTHEYLYVTDEKGLVFLIQMGVVEIHPWGATADNIDYPKRMIFDLDPDPSVPFEAVKLAALDVRQRLKKRYKLESFVRTTGGKGLHIIVPLDGKSQDWAAVKSFAENFADDMVRDVPDAYVATMTKSKRAGKIFVDFFRNDYTATAIADYAVRARPGAPVAVPLDWNELDDLKAGNAFTVKDVLKRIKTVKIDQKRYTLKQKLPD
jgi:bifunctional non-homologous end joining protein LigD